MTKITMPELDRIMCEYNRKHTNRQDFPSVAGVIVFKASNFNKLYPEKSRSYRVYNSCRRFQDGKISNQLTGYCLDGTDQGVRLDWYNWEVEYCYLETPETPEEPEVYPCDLSGLCPYPYRLCKDCKLL